MSGPDYAPNHDFALAEIGNAKNYNDWLFGRARPFLGRHVVDAGAGIGTFTALAATEAESVVALEPHPPFAAHLRSQFAQTPNVRVVESDAAAARDEELADRADSV